LPTLLKILTAATTFGVIVGGWLLLQREEARKLAWTPLPGADGPQGKCALWFIGSSSIHRWFTLKDDMKPWIANNRGIDGATFLELGPRFAADPSPVPPDAIILYAGENDIAGGRTAQQSIADLNRFLDDKTRKFRETPVFVISMKPSPTRWRFFAEQRRYNIAAARIGQQRPDVTFVNIVPLLLKDGRPGNFYRPDGIHMTEAGYELWAAAIRDALRKYLPSGTAAACDPPVSRPGAPAASNAAH
jgi:lysophospholipase L1-like esterase